MNDYLLSIKHCLPLVSNSTVNINMSFQTGITVRISSNGTETTGLYQNAYDNSVTVTASTLEVKLFFTTNNISY